MSPGRSWRRFDLELSLLNKVLTSAESCLSSTGNNRDAQARLFVEPGENGFGFPVGVGGDRVHCILAVNGHEKDVRGRVGKNIGIGFWGIGLEIGSHDKFSGVIR